MCQLCGESSGKWRRKNTWQSQVNMTSKQIQNRRKRDGTVDISYMNKKFELKSRKINLHTFFFYSFFLYFLSGKINTIKENSSFFYDFLWDGQWEACWKSGCCWEEESLAIAAPISWNCWANFSEWNFKTRKYSVDATANSIKHVE